MLADFKMGGMLGGLLKPTFAYITSNSSATDATSYTFAGTSLGTAGPNRLIVVGTALRSVASNSYSSVTVGGNAMSNAVVRNAAQTNVGLHYLLVPTGTSADIVVTVTGTASRCGIGVWALYNLAQTAARSTASDTAATLALSLNTQPDAIACAITYTGGSTSEVWTGMTENFDVAPEGSHILGASVQCTTAEVPRTMTCAITGGAGIGGVSAIWR